MFIFRKDNGTRDQIMNTGMVCEKQIEHNKNMYIGASSNTVAVKPLTVSTLNLLYYLLSLKISSSGVPERHL